MIEQLWRFKESGLTMSQATWLSIKSQRLLPAEEMLDRTEQEEQDVEAEFGIAEAKLQKDLFGM